jgi:ribonuclease HII
MTQLADLTYESTLLSSGHRFVGGLDEVGRGAWAGPMFVGAVVIDVACGPLPVGTKDSKCLSSAARRRLVPELEEWCVAWAIGEVSAREIDRIGLSAALRLAATRAIGGLSVAPDALIVDGPVDFVTRRRGRSEVSRPAVHPMVDGDERCGSVAAASILAKLARDGRMSSLARKHPVYGFDENKGYGTTQHAKAIESHGLCVQHRRSWALPSSDVDRLDRALFDT